MTPLHQTRPRKRIVSSLGIFGILYFVPALFAAGPMMMSFDLPAEAAEQALKRFAAQSGLEVLFVTETAAKVKTNAVKGEYSPKQAIDRMLAGTILVANEDAKSGAMKVSKTTHPPGRTTSHPTGDGHARDSQKKNMTETPQTQEPMKRNTILTKLAAILTLMVAAPADAQVAPATGAPTAKEETIEMSPFEVSASADRGYAASQTLAGTRLSTDIKNVAAQITVMTPDFLRDIAATTMDEAMLYSLNVENGQEYYENPQLESLGGVEQLNRAQRVRGLANASLTRDFFETFFQQDSYNSERFTFNSGPNAILFGLGSAGGIIDQSLKRARFGKPIYRLSLRADSEGSRRAEVDISRELIEKKLALRVAAVNGLTESWKKPSRDRVRRQYITATFRPFEKTSLRVAWENIQREAALPRNTLVKDRVTPYLTWRANRMQQLGITDPLDSRLYWAPNNQLSPGEAPFATGQGTPFNVFAGTQVWMLTGKLSPDTPGSALLNRWTGGAVSRSPLEEFSSPDKIPRSITDPSIFPYDINIGGLATDNHQTGRDININLEQKITPDLFVEVAYNKESYDQYFSDYARGLDQQLRIDVNRYIPFVTDAAGQPVLNPNRGRYYVMSWSRGNLMSGYSEAGRVTASYTLDLTKQSGWKRWLGRHDFAGLVDRTRKLERYQNYRALLTSDSPDVNIANRAAKNRTTRRVNTAVYLDAPGTPGGRSYYDPAYDATELYNQTYGAYQNVSVLMRNPDLGRGGWTPGTATATRATSRMLALQSRFWQDRIFATYGRNATDFKSKVNMSSQIDPVGPAATRPWYWNNAQDVTLVPEPDVDDNPDINSSSSVETKGVVVFPLKWLSLHYNMSANSSAGATSFSPLGGLLEPSSGEGRDYGFGLQLFEKKLYLRINWYENSQINNPSSEFDALKFRAASVERRLQFLAEENPGVGFMPTGWQFDNTNNTGVHSDFDSRGLEATMTANLTPNWRMSLNVAKTRSVETNIATAWRQYAAQRLPEWQKFYSYPWNDSSSQTVGSWVESNLFFQYLDRAALMEGRPSTRVRKWRVNLVTSYDFSSGGLKNFGVGGAVRWRDKASIGSPYITREDGSLIPDIRNSYYDKGMTDIDGWLSYRARLWKDKVRARFQLNVRNIFNRDGLLPQAAISDGTPVLFTAQAPRLFIFSATFEL